MTIHYLDPSAWVKRYIAEAGSDDVATLFDDAELVACSRLGMVEIAATIARKGRYEKLGRDILDSMLAQARADFAAFERVSLSDELVQAAESLAFAHALRTGDAVHLASAVSLTNRKGTPDVIMVSADVELLAAAAAKGLATLNPGKVGS